MTPNVVNINSLAYKIHYCSENCFISTYPDCPSFHMVACMPFFMQTSEIMDFASIFSVLVSD